MQCAFLAGLLPSRLLPHAEDRAGRGASAVLCGAAGVQLHRQEGPGPGVRVCGLRPRLSSLSDSTGVHLQQRVSVWHTAAALHFLFFGVIVLVHRNSPWAFLARVVSCNINLPAKFSGEIVMVPHDSMPLRHEMSLSRHHGVVRCQCRTT